MSGLVFIERSKPSILRIFAYSSPTIALKPPIPVPDVVRDHPHDLRGLGVRHGLPGQAHQALSPRAGLTA